MSSMASSHFLHLTTFHQSSRHSLPFLNNHHHRTILTTTTTTKIIYNFEIRASNGVGDNNNGDSLSYLKMWRQAVDRERKEDEFRRISQNLSHNNGDEGSSEGLEKKSSEFQKILQVSKEERDRAQRLQVIDRASAAIAAARALLRDKKDAAFAKASSKVESDNIGRLSFETNNGGTDSRNLYNRQARVSGDEPPGPNFWSWTPPPEVSSGQTDVDNIEKVPKTSGDSYPTIDVMIKERSADSLSLPLESTYSESKLVPPLPPFQSLMEVHNVEASDVNQEASVVNEELSSQFSAHALEAAHALHNIEGKPSHGVNPDGSRWWKETGVERRPDGVVCRWTLNRGVSANGVVEWEEKYWEAADEFDFKELGSEKSGRDAFGNVWHESWKESMWQEDGLLHMEKTADKWGKNAINEEWQEQWLEHYDASGKADKWAHKWCSIDPNTQVDVGHAHVWHERWGEKYDGQGGSIKYTDKWAERSEGDGWVKWGDKWDENFDLNGHGVKQGETWWEGKYGDRWNRTWGEHHNGSGWLHKYGKSSCGEHWDTHVQEDTWYERYPHFGFMHCFENSVQLREVQKPSEKL